MSSLSKSLQVLPYRFLHLSQHGLHFVSSQCVFLFDTVQSVLSVDGHKLEHTSRGQVQACTKLRR